MMGGRYSSDSVKSLYRVPGKYLLKIELPKEKGWCKFCKGRTSKVISRSSAKCFVLQCEKCNSLYLETVAHFSQKYLGENSLYGHVPEGITADMRQAYEESLAKQAESSTYEIE